MVEDEDRRATIRPIESLFMPFFFIDTSDQKYFCVDDVGQEFPDLGAATAAAVDALPDMARDALPDGDNHTFMAVVRGEDGFALLQASLMLSVTALTPGEVH